jgi:hypothetical protein
MVIKGVATLEFSRKLVSAEKHCWQYPAAFI